MFLKCRTIKNLSILLSCFAFCNANATTNPFKLLWGRTAPTEIIFAPFGYHLFDSSNEQYFFHAKPDESNDAQYLVSFHWKSIAVGTFTNSERHQVEFLALYRQLIYYKRFALADIIGVMTGYGRDAKKIHPPPYMGSIVNHDPGAFAVWDATIALTKHFSFHAVCAINFQYMTLGVGYVF